ncbi:MAG: GNAT family N-acetyltransferase [Novosphingobium sp.]
MARRAAGILFDEYRINWIVASPSGRRVPPERDMRPVGREEHALLAGSPTYKVRNALSFGAAGLDGFALIVDEKPVCVAHFANPGQYDRASTWPLAEREVALMDIATEEEGRGKGIAARLIIGAESHYVSRGAGRLIAFIWWSNTPSVRAFRKAGWRRIGLSIEVRRAGHWFGLRCPLGRG